MTISEGGVVPFIHSVLLKKGSKDIGSSGGGQSIHDVETSSQVSQENWSGEGRKRNNIYDNDNYILYP